MKYIDADKLKVELDKHYQKYQNKYMETRNPYTQGLIDALDLAEQSIDSLQQEQQEVNLEEEIQNFFDDRQLWDIQLQPSMEEVARHFYQLGKNSK